MTSKEIVLTAHRNMGRADALALREKAVAKEITDTEIIDREQMVPEWNPRKDYTNTPTDAPVACEGQVYGLIQPHNASHYPDANPAVLAALWRVKHTTNPDKAKPFVKPTSTSDMYLVGECMIWTDGTVRTALRDTIYSPDEYAPDWTEAPVVEEPTTEPETPENEPTEPDVTAPLPEENSGEDVTEGEEVTETETTETEQEGEA